MAMGVLCSAAAISSLPISRRTSKGGSLWAAGQAIDGIATGYREWFCKDGTKIRSGTFVNGEQTGEWTTYDKKGNIFKVTNIKPKGK